MRQSEKKKKKEKENIYIYTHTVCLMHGLDRGDIMYSTFNDNRPNTVLVNREIESQRISHKI